jgi:Holliday junction resolvasome RuvABC endonuclease subunit
MRATGMGGRTEIIVLKEIREILKRMEERLSAIEKSFKKENSKKQLLND